MEAYKIRRKFKNDKALYFNMQRHPGLPHGLWIWRVHWVREMCVHRIGVIYGKHPTLEEKEMQVELLIDKIQTNDNSTKGIIIDAARLELCNLTNAQISLLAFIIICGLIIESKEKKELFDYFQGHSGLLSDIQSMEEVDFAYLQHTNCLHRISFIKNADLLEKNLFSKYAEWQRIWIMKQI